MHFELTNTFKTQKDQLSSSIKKYYFGVAILVGITWMIHSCTGKINFPDEISYNTHIRPILSDKCFKCHGPDANKREAGFRLDTEEGAMQALKSKEGYAIVSGKPEESILYVRIIDEDPEVVMPPPEANLSLTDKEKELVRKWIEQGGHYEKHWSFIPISKPIVPNMGKSWATNEIDPFIARKLQENGLNYSEEEDPYLLLRRMKHDLTGIPPSIEEQEEFSSQDNPDWAYEQAVDAALASHHYGEKMAILWMDLARYADSHGYQDDGLRTMWPWRDWVIHAFNENYSYKKFITYQLAGDLLPEANKESILATGFNRNHKITQEGGVIDEEYRIEYVTDRTNTFGKGILAITLECAKCHDHKYDPISQKDYYSTFAFFNQVPEKGIVGDINLGSLADPPKMSISDEEVDSILNFINKQDTADVEVMVMQDDSIKRPTFVLDRGVYDSPTEEVPMMAPPAIMPFDSTVYEKNRAGLADWLFNEKNPLTSRVFVNLIWQEIFGRGIVRTAGDFGLQGDLPTHPELLDWLAADFMENGWDIKRLIKQMVMSSTYRQSQNVTADRYAKDPENIFLSRGPRHKLPAELTRDHILATSGLLNDEIGGPSVKPYQPDGLWETASSGRGRLKTYIQDRGKDLYRRGLYTFIKRTVPPPSMLIFDASNRDQCEVSRTSTTTPLQALVLMNDPQVLEASRFFAQRLQSEHAELKTLLSTAFQTIVCRPPKGKELSVLEKYFLEISKELTEEKAISLLAVGEIELSNQEPVMHAALMQTIQMIYNLEETSMR
jgi:hypothetical protein